jgi:hypothetical protein
VTPAAPLVPLPLFEQKSSTPVEVRESCTYGDFALKTAQAVDPSAKRHGGNTESVAAFKRVQVETDELHVLTLIVSAGDVGLTSAEIELAWGRAKNRFSGRISSLCFDKYIERVGVRNKCGIWRATPKGVERIGVAK